MKKYQWMIGIGSSLCLIAPGVAEDHWPDQYSGIGIEANINDGLDVNEDIGQDNLDSYGAIGLTFEQQFNKKWGAFFKFDGSEVDLDNLNGTADVMRFTAGLRRYAVKTRIAGWRPFIGGGVGYTDIDYENLNSDDDLPSVNVEAGVQGLFNSWIAELGVRGSHEFADSDDSNGHAFVGLRYLFNKKSMVSNAAAIAAIPAAVAMVDNKKTMPVKLTCTQQDLLSTDYFDTCMKALQDSMQLSLNVLFDTDKSTVKPSQMMNIERVANILARYPNVRLMLGGHTDNQGEVLFNQRLSEQRSAAVKSILVDQFSIDSGRIITTGFGELNPIADNDQRQGRQLNRRVDAIVGFGDLEQATREIVSGE